MQRRSKGLEFFEPPGLKTSWCGFGSSFHIAKAASHQRNGAAVLLPHGQQQHGRGALGQVAAEGGGHHGLHVAAGHPGQGHPPALEPFLGRGATCRWHQPLGQQKEVLACQPSLEKKGKRWNLTLGCSR